jgi:hypothetical protein
MTPQTGSVPDKLTKSNDTNVVLNAGIHPVTQTSPFNLAQPPLEGYSEPD